MSTSPNFLIIGANKGGTTSLFQYLKEHPDVFVPAIKEPMFFNYYQRTGDDGVFRTQKVIKTFDSYRKLFEGSENFKARGEASTSYLANPFCAKNIHDFNPEMKILAVLRNPIERAFSNYLMYVRWKDESRSFSKAIKDEMSMIDLPQGKQYIYLGRYLESLKTYNDIFGAAQLRIFLNEDLKTHPHKSFREICSFLEIDESFVPNFNKRYNTNDSVEIRFPHKTLKKIDKRISFSEFLPKQIKNKLYSKPTIPKEEKKILQALYKEEITELSQFLNRDLTHWLV